MAIAARSTRLNLKEFKLPRNNYEMVCAVGSSSKAKRKIAVISIYIPPKQKASTTEKMKECLVDGINKLKVQYDDPILLIGGDTNNRSLAALLEDFSELVVLDVPATRMGRKLDETASNLGNNILKISTMPPLQSLAGTDSDHDTVLGIAKMSTGHHFTKKQFFH